MAAALVCAGTLTATVGLQAASASSPGRAEIGAAVPATVRAHPVGAVTNTSAVNFELVLKLRDETGAEQLVRAVATPGSASYRHYLTAQQWEARFSPTAAQVQQAEQWLRSEGFAVGAVSKDRITIAASGSAAQVESAFGTGLENYAVNGHRVRLATGALSVPSSMAGTIVGAMGINQRLARPADGSNPDIPGSSASTAPTTSSPTQFPPPPAAFLTHPPCGQYYAAKTHTVSPPFGQGYPTTVPDVVCGYKPPQLRSAYGVTTTATGNGVDVAIIDAYGSATITSDAAQYFLRNDPGNPFSKANFTQTNTLPFDDESVCGASGWLTEQAIDVEAVHSMAPNAHIHYFGAQDCENGLFDTEQNVIDNRLADVVTNSWGDTGGDLLDDASTKTAYDDLFMLADTTGMTILFSSGDDGDDFADFGFSSADYPPSSPFVTAVGGTTLKIGAAGQRIGELGWDTGRSFLCTANAVNQLPGCTASTLNTWLPAALDGASGGYTSYYYTQPWYQAPVVPTDLSERNAPIFGPVPLRVVPDISLDADPGTGFLIGLTQTLLDGSATYTQTRYGGTSLASPLLAGVVADADQSAGVSVGFINPAIYRLDTSDPSTIYDILPEVGKQANYRVDFANTYAPGVAGTFTSFRELYFSGDEVFCDATGNCASRPFPLAVTKGYDALTGLGSPGTGFIAALAGP